jgi:hypothetical protein
VTARLEKLAAAGIEIIPAEIASHFILARDGFVAFVERRENDFGNIGAPGLMTERGFALCSGAEAKRSLWARPSSCRPAPDRWRRSGHSPPTCKPPSSKENVGQIENLRADFQSAHCKFVHFLS